MATFYEETGTIVDEWHVDDVLNQRPDLTEEQSCEVLALIAHNFDANIGINWDVIDSAAEYLFPEDFCQACEDGTCPELTPNEDSIDA
jgi:hypothetical protein